MKNLHQNITRFVKHHRFLIIASAGVLVVGLCFGCLGIMNMKNLQLTRDSVSSQISSNCDLSQEEIESLEASGMLGQEIVDPNTGETVVLTQNEDGSFSKMVIADANGNSTGTTVPNNHTSEGSSSHEHNWVVHYASRAVQTGEKYIVDIEAQNAVYERVCVSPAGTYCNTCGACVTGHQAQMEHTNATGHGGTHSQAAKYEDRLVKAAVPEQGHYEPVYTTEQYVDYYYCSECGTRQ